MRLTRITPGFPKAQLRNLAFFLTALALLLQLGCSGPPEELVSPAPDQHTLVQDGISLPRFDTAENQLNYAFSGLIDPKEKMAAFRAVLARFPQDRPACARAALGLAYLYLEPEYRFATDLEIRQSINDFERVLADYGDLPDIRAKALWYLGWSHTELNNDPDLGLPYYWQIVHTLGNVPMHLSPTVPWINLVYTQESSLKALKPAGPQTYWAQVALLEIVRNSPDTAQTLSAFQRLMDRFGASQAAGLALKHMLSHPKLASHALPLAAVYLNQPRTNPYLARDIRALMEKAGS